MYYMNILVIYEWYVFGVWIGFWIYFLFCCFLGENCIELIFVECYDGFCKNNGSCIVNVLDNILNCICDIGWKGEICEEEYNFCEFNLCLRNGICVYIKNVGYVCECLFDL